MIDENVLNQIVEAAQVESNVPVVEIGAGLGQAIQLAQQPAGYMKGIRHERESQQQHADLITAIKTKP